MEKGIVDDSAVVADILAGNREAYRALVDKYAPRVLAFCRSRTGSEEEASDAAQDVFIRAYSSLAKFRRGESFAAWLFAIAANQVRTRFRLILSDRIKQKAAFNELAASGSPDPTEEAERKMDTETLRRAVSALPWDLRMPVELYYFGELSVAETARALRIGEEAVKSRLFRARKALRISLEGRQRTRGS